jgi:hypothetical protein
MRLPRNWSAGGWVGVHLHYECPFIVLLNIGDDDPAITGFRGLPTYLSLY